MKEKRRKATSVRFSEAELQLIDLAAQLQGQRRSDFLREAAKAKAIEAIHIHRLLDDSQRNNAETTKPILLERD
ncbi:MAG: DUF1778 domain-containing protein [Halothece sp.]